MKSISLLLAFVVAGCGASLRPHPGNWKPYNHREGTFPSRQFGNVMVIIEDPRFENGVVAVRMWLKNSGNDPVHVDPKDLILVERDGNLCSNDAKGEPCELSGIGDERVLGEFAVKNPERCAREGFALRFQVAPYTPLRGRPLPIEFTYSRD